jgi:iron(III)-enterobactin esterase
VSSITDTDTIDNYLHLIKYTNNIAAEQLRHHSSGIGMMNTLPIKHCQLQPDFDQVSVPGITAIPGTEAWWSEIKKRGTPLSSHENNDVAELLFFWRQPPQQDIHSVFIDLFSCTPHPCQQLTHLQQLAGTDIWFWRVRIPADWCGSYRLIPVEPGQIPRHLPTGTQRRLWWLNILSSCAEADPLNHNPPYGKAEGCPLSWLDIGEEAQASRLLQSPGRGTLSTLDWHSRMLGNRRTVTLYRTHPTDSQTTSGTESIPLILLLDGQWWSHELPLFQALDQLTQSGQLPAAYYLLPDSLSTATRYHELGCSKQFWNAIQTELLPLVAATTGSVQARTVDLVAGQSLGGLAALYAHLYWPETFQAACCQSASFWWPDVDLADPQLQQTDPRQAWLIDQVCRQNIPSPRQPRQVQLQTGCYEDGMIELSQQMHQALQDNGHHSQLSIFRGGHDRICWRKALLEGLCQHFSATSPSCHQPSNRKPL